MKLKTAFIYITILAIGYVAGIATVLSHDPHSGHGIDESLPHSASAPGGHFEGEDVEAPDFTLPSIGGGDVSLSDFRGKWVFVNFWATWCGPCVVEMPMMNNLYKELKDEGFDMVAISVDKNDAADVQAFVDEHKLDFTILHDRDNSIMKMYGVTTLPLSYIISPEGHVIAQSLGAREWDNPVMIQYIRDLMAGKITDDESDHTAGVDTVNSAV